MTAATAHAGPGSSSETALEVSGLVKSFGERRALDGIKMSVAPAEVHGLLGPNGAGKTTLLRVLLGLVRPDAGDVRLFGAPAPDYGEPPAAGIAGQVEAPSFYPYLSARMNLELAQALDGGGPPQELTELLARVGLADRAEDRVSGFSSGMRQRLGIAASLLRHPRLLLLDEPTEGLDPGGIEAVLELIAELARSGVAILLSGHRIEEVEATCARFTVIRAGRVVWSGTRERLRAEAPSAIFQMRTSDDARAEQLARTVDGIALHRGAGGELMLEAPEQTRDAFVLLLAQDGIAVRELELRQGSLQSLFARLTDDPAPTPE